MKTVVLLEHPVPSRLTGFPPVHGKALDASGIWRLRVLASLFSWEGNEGTAARARPRFT